jgi:hypothetical protein
MVLWRSKPQHNRLSAEVAELADAHGSGPCTRKGVGVRVPSSAPMIFARGPSTRSARSGFRQRAQKPANGSSYRKI